MPGDVKLNKPHNECKVLGFAIIPRFIINPLEATAVRTLRVSIIVVFTLHCNIACRLTILFHSHSEKDTGCKVMVFLDQIFAPVV